HCWVAEQGNRLDAGHGRKDHQGLPRPCHAEDAGRVAVAELVRMVAILETYAPQTAQLEPITDAGSLLHTARGSGNFPPRVLSRNAWRLLCKALFSWVVVRAKRMRDSAENSETLCIGGGEPWRMRSCWRISLRCSKGGVTYGGFSRTLRCPRRPV